MDYSGYGAGYGGAGYGAGYGACAPVSTCAPVATSYCAPAATSYCAPVECAPMAAPMAAPQQQVHLVGTATYGSSWLLGKKKFKGYENIRAYPVTGADYYGGGSGFGTGYGAGYPTAGYPSTGYGGGYGGMGGYPM
eukprot:195623_1